MKGRDAGATRRTTRRAGQWGSWRPQHLRQPHGACAAVLAEGRHRRTHLPPQARSPITRPNKRLPSRGLWNASLFSEASGAGRARGITTPTMAGRSGGCCGGDQEIRSPGLRHRAGDAGGPSEAAVPCHPADHVAALHTAWLGRQPRRRRLKRANKRMQLTKLRAAPVLQAEVPPCAPAGQTDGGTASQLIRSVGPTIRGASETRVSRATSWFIPPAWPLGMTRRMLKLT